MLVPVHPVIEEFELVDDLTVNLLYGLAGQPVSPTFGFYPLRSRRVSESTFCARMPIRGRPAGQPVAGTASEPMTSPDIANCARRCQSVLVRATLYFLAAGLLVQAHASDLQRVRFNNPGLEVDLGVGLWAWPLPMDYDEDGDLDLVVSSGGRPYEGTYFFENPSGPDATDPMPVFRPGVKIAEYRTNAQISHIEGRPSVVTTPEERHDTFRQHGFAKPTSLGLDTEKVYSSKGRIRAKQWRLADWEGDGDLDLLVGVGDWGDYGWDDAYDSEGRWTNGPLHGFVYLALRQADGSFGEPEKLLADGMPVDVYGMPSPSLADFDSDGDLDLICGEFLDGFTYFENTGTRQRPVLAEGKRLGTDGRPLKMDLQMITPTSVDWDRDGDIDLIVGDEDGRVAFIENLGAIADGVPQFAQPRYFRQIAEFVKFGALVTPQAADWDGDGDEDILAGNTAGLIGLIENLGGTPPQFAAAELLQAGGETIRLQAGPNGSIQGPCEAKWGYSTIGVADWDGDGLLDILANSIWGRIVWYRNIGSKESPRLEAARAVRIDWRDRPRAPAWNWWVPGHQEMVSQWRTRPVPVDWNRDGLMDLVMLDHEGYLALFRRIRGDRGPILLPGERIFESKPASAFDNKHNPLNDVPGLLRLNARRAGGSGRRKIDLVDWNGDGRLDLLVNSTSVDLLLNRGLENGRTIFSQDGPLSGTKLGGHTTSPTTVDWDGDGKRELLFGAEDGFLYWSGSD